MRTTSEPADVLTNIALCDEVADAPLGDVRRSRRFARVVELMSRKPDSSIPDAMGATKELEAYYRLMRNDAVDHFKLLEPHFDGTRERSEALGQVLVVHDTTEFAFEIHDEPARENVPVLSANRQGFYWHASLAVTADNTRVPLGLMASCPFVHNSQVDDKTTQQLWEEIDGVYDNEKWRWMDGVEQSEQRLDDVAQVIHIQDREGDDFESLSAMTVSNYDFVIRMTYDRNIADGPCRKDYRKLSEALQQVQWQHDERDALLSARPRRKADSGHPVRRGRKARLKVRSTTAQLRRPDSVKTAHALDRIEVNIVEVLEKDPPEGEEPVRWLLVTNQPVDTAEQIWQVVDWYRARWTIEEYFKAVKTGAAYKKLQHKRAATLLAALSAKAVIAWHLLVLRHIGREAGHSSPIGVVNPLQLQVLRALKPEIIGTNPTTADVMNAIARLGGHIPNNGPPGWLVLGRGWRHMREVEKGFRLGLQADQDEVEM